MRTRAHNKLIENERKRSEDLLLNILPKEIANELKETGESIPRHYDEASVLFCDFCNFSSIAENLTAGELVSNLNECFAKFDDIIASHGLEKIKTIGDEYMCAGGLNTGEDHLERMVAAAMDMQLFLKFRKDNNLIFSAARIGIHFGPLVAGIVGKSKFAYDIWGETVNMASRLQSTSEVDKINTSKVVREKLKDQYTFKDRGLIEVKNLGKVEMHFINPN